MLRHHVSGTTCQTPACQTRLPILCQQSQRFLQCCGEPLSRDLVHRLPIRHIGEGRFEISNLASWYHIYTRGQRRAPALRRRDDAPRRLPEARFDARAQAGTTSRSSPMRLARQPLPRRRSRSVRATSRGRMQELHGGYSRIDRPRPQAATRTSFGTASAPCVDRGRDRSCSRRSATSAERRSSIGLCQLPASGAGAASAPSPVSVRPKAARRRSGPRRSSTSDDSDRARERFVAFVDWERLRRPDERLRPAGWTARQWRAISARVVTQTSSRPGDVGEEPVEPLRARPAARRCGSAGRPRACARPPPAACRARRGGTGRSRRP